MSMNEEVRYHLAFLSLSTVIQNFAACRHSNFFFSPALSFLATQETACVQSPAKRASTRYKQGLCQQHQHVPFLTVLLVACTQMRCVCSAGESDSSFHHPLPLFLQGRNWQRVFVMGLMPLIHCKWVMQVLDWELV